MKLHEETSESSYSLLSSKFLEVISKFAPLKKNILRGNHSPFVTKEFTVYKSYLQWTLSISNSQGIDKLVRDSESSR